MSLPMGESGEGHFWDPRYGALMDIHLVHHRAKERDLQPYRRMNALVLLQVLFLPWIAFLVTFAAVSFYVHYWFPLSTVLSVAATFGGSIWVCIAALRNRSQESHKRFFLASMSATVACAVFFGWLLGDLNFWGDMQPAYETEHLAAYSNVNPSTEKLWSGEAVPTRGRRYQDVGRIYFTSSTVIDVNRSANFKVGNLYCVAPIVDPNCRDNCGFDFWAVGVNCCDEDGRRFHCGDYTNPLSKAGIRLTSEGRRQSFRMAVMAAESIHGLTSVHPLFFMFVKDPVAVAESWKRKGYRRFVVVMFVSFFAGILNVILVANISRKW
mmetsp:Transcript_31978/g.62922  ORF Transcript_31978/g.62922 Transcript_31978/m.62922 type:complete len:324 (+) Transcript_31978:169-1140(+)